jgi:UDP-glucose 4-epimerase
MKVIVAGSNGFIGTHLIRKLSEKGAQIVAIVQNQGQDISGIASYCSQIFYCDLANIAQCSEISKENNEETVFVNLAWRGVNGADKGVYAYQLSNIKMLCDAAQYAKEIGCSKYIAAGTVAENAIESLHDLPVANPGLFYGVGKASGRDFLEVLCKSIGLPFVWAQFSNIYGPGNKTGNLISYTLSQFAKNEKASFGPADQPYDFVYIDDLIEALARLILSKNHSNFYCISSGSPRILKDYLLSVGKAAAKENLIGIGQRQSDHVIYRFDMFDNSALVKDIGNYVSVSFEEGLAKTIQWEKQQ